MGLRRGDFQETGENCVVITFMISAPDKILLGLSNQGG
jgi:hypothetical protein